MSTSSFVYTSPWPMKSKGLSQRTKSETDMAKAQDRANHARLHALLKKAGNRECADCSARFPGWGVLPHGVFVCINCAQVHRHIGRHISQTKGITTNTYLWYPDEVDLMEFVGNDRANSVYMARGGGGILKPREDAPFDARLSYIRDKYEHQRYLDASKTEQAHPVARPAAPSPASAASTTTRAAIPTAVAFVPKRVDAAKTSRAASSCRTQAVLVTTATMEKNLIDLSDWEGFLNSK